MGKGDTARRVTRSQTAATRANSEESKQADLPAATSLPSIAAPQAFSPPVEGVAQDPRVPRDRSKELGEDLVSLFNKQGSDKTSPEYRALKEAKKAAVEAAVEMRDKVKDLKENEAEPAVIVAAEQQEEEANEAWRKAYWEFAKFKALVPDAWMALNVRLPATKLVPSPFRKNTTKFLHVPIAAIRVSLREFLSSYLQFESKNKELKKLEEIRSLRQVKPLTEVHPESYGVTWMDNELAVSVRMWGLFNILFRGYFLLYRDILQPGYEYAFGSKSTFGNMDAGLYKIVGDMAVPTIAVEVNCADGEHFGLNYSGAWCRSPCTDPSCKSERHMACSPIRQLYNYMVLNGLLFGLICSYDSWVGLIRDCDGNLYVIDTVKQNDICYSVPLLITMFCRMAADPTKALAILQETIKVPITEHKNCPINGSPHTQLPTGCDAVQENETHGNEKTKGFRGSPTADNNGSALSSTSVHRLCSRTRLGRGRLGTTWLHVEDKTKVVKLVDIGKSTKEVKDPLGEIVHELNIYNKLRSLEKEQVIPKVYASGVTFELFLFAIVMEHAGQPISKYRGDNLALLKEQALRKLDMIHQAGVLHGDIRAANILVDEQGQVVRFIDFNGSRFVGPMDTTEASRAALDEVLELKRIFA